MFLNSILIYGNSGYMSGDFLQDMFQIVTSRHFLKLHFIIVATSQSFLYKKKEKYTTIFAFMVVANFVTIWCPQLYMKKTFSEHKVTISFVLQNLLERRSDVQIGNNRQGHNRHIYSFEKA